MYKGEGKKIIIMGYGGGFRVSEVTTAKKIDIDRYRMVIHLKKSNYRTCKEFKVNWTL